MESNHYLYKRVITAIVLFLTFAFSLLIISSCGKGVNVIGLKAIIKAVISVAENTTQYKNFS